MKFWEKNTQDIKALIQVQDHAEFCTNELKELEVEMKKSEDIFDPLIDEAKRENEKLNRLSNEKLKALNIGYQIQLMIWINYLMQGRRVCDEVKRSIFYQIMRMDVIKVELQGVTIVGMPKFWRADNTPILEIELISKIQ